MGMRIPWDPGVCKNSVEGGFSPSSWWPTASPSPPSSSPPPSPSTPASDSSVYPPPHTLQYTLKIPKYTLTNIKNFRKELVETYRDRYIYIYICRNHPQDHLCHIFSPKEKYFLKLDITPAEIERRTQFLRNDNWNAFLDFCRHHPKSLYNPMPSSSQSIHLEDIKREYEIELMIWLALLRNAIDGYVKMFNSWTGTGTKGLMRIPWDPGESLYEKLVKTSWDVHQNPGPPSEIKEYILTLEEFDPSKYEDKDGLGEEGMYKFEITPTTIPKEKQSK